MNKWILVSLLAALMILPMESSGQMPAAPEGWQNWPAPKWLTQESLDATYKETSKKLDIVKGLSRPGLDIELLQSKASDLLKRFKQAGDNLSKNNLLLATNALLDAAYGIYSSRKADRVSQDFWGISRDLQFLYFHRVQGTDYFEKTIFKKNFEQYIKLARSLYYQAQSACDAHEYQKAKYLADASASVMTAMDFISLAEAPPPGMFK
jgi:hypothetical protein